MPNASYSVVITAVSTPDQAAPALAKTCAIETEVAATILRKAPITLLRELSDDDVAFVKPHLLRMSSTGLDFKITPKPVTDLPKVNWPAPPDLHAMFAGGVEMAPPQPAPGPPPRKGHTSRIPAPTPDVVVLDVHCPCCQAGLKVRKVEGQVQVQEVTPPKVNPLPTTPVHQRTVEELTGYGNAPVASPVVKQEEAEVSYTNSPLLDSAPVPAAPPPSLDRPAAPPRRQEVGAPAAAPPGFQQSPSPSPPPAAPASSPAAAPGFQVNRPKRDAAPDAYSAHVADQEPRAAAQPQASQVQDQQMVESRDDSGDARPNYGRQNASLDPSPSAPPLGFAVNRPRRGGAPFAPPPSQPAAPEPQAEAPAAEDEDYELPPVTSPFVILEQPQKPASFPTPEQKQQADGLDLDGLGLDESNTEDDAALNAALQSQGSYEPGEQPPPSSAPQDPSAGYGDNGESAPVVEEPIAHEPAVEDPATAHAHREVGRMHESGLHPEPESVDVAGDFLEQSEAPALRIVSEELHLYRSETGIAAARGNGPDGFQDAAVATSDSNDDWSADQAVADPDLEAAHADLEAAEAAMQELEVSQAAPPPAPFPGAQRGPTRPPPPPESAPLTPAQRASLSIDAVGELDELNTLPEDDARITKVMMSLNPNLAPPTMDNAEQAAADAHQNQPMFDPTRQSPDDNAQAGRGTHPRIDEVIHSADHSGLDAEVQADAEEDEDLEPWTGRARDYRDPDLDEPAAGAPAAAPAFEQPAGYDQSGEFDESTAYDDAAADDGSAAYDESAADEGSWDDGEAWDDEAAAAAPLESDLGDVELMESAASVDLGDGMGGPMLSEPEIAAGVEEVGVEPASIPAVAPMSLEAAEATLQAREAMAHMQDELDDQDFAGEAGEAVDDAAFAPPPAEAGHHEDDGWGDHDSGQVWGSAELGVVAEDNLDASEADDDGDLEPWTGRARDYVEPGQTDAAPADAAAAPEATDEDENFEPWTGRARDYVDPDGPPDVGEALVAEGAGHDALDDAESLEPWSGGARNYVDPDAPADVEALMPGDAAVVESAATMPEDDGLEPWTGRARDYEDPEVKPKPKPKPQAAPAASAQRPAAATPAAAKPAPAKPAAAKPAAAKSAPSKPAAVEPPAEQLDDIGFEDDLEPTPAAQQKKTSSPDDFKLDADDLGDLDFADEPAPKAAATSPATSADDIPDLDDIPELDDLPEPAPAKPKGKDKKKTGKIAKEEKKKTGLFKKTGKVTSADGSGRAPAGGARPGQTGRVPAKGSTRGPAAGRGTGRVGGPPSGRGPRPTRRMPPKKKGPVGPDGLPLDDDIDLSDELKRAGAGAGPADDDDLDAILGKIDLDAPEGGDDLGGIDLDDELTLESRQQLKPTAVKTPSIDETIKDAEPELDLSSDDDGEPDLDLSLEDEPKPAASARRGRAGGGGATGWTLFLSKPNSVNKVDEAVQLLAELKGCSAAEAKQLVSRMVIPVLKDVPQDQAEDGLAKIKKAGLSGRVTQKK